MGDRKSRSPYRGPLPLPLLVRSHREAVAQRVREKYDIPPAGGLARWRAANRPALVERWEEGKK